MKTNLIALTGFAGVGKDTVADLLVTHCHFRKLAFADALYGEVATAFGVDVAYLRHPSTKNIPIAALAMRRAPRDFLAAVALSVPGLPRDVGGNLAAEWLDAARSPRQILQWWGTEYRRNQQPNYWVQRLALKLHEMARNGACRFVVTDCRFENEAQCIRGAGGVIWQVKRPDIDAATTAEGTHVSVTSGDVFRPAAVISNSHDMRHLQQLVLGEFLALDTGIVGARVVVPV